MVAKVEGYKSRGKTSMRWIDSIKENTAFGFQDQSSTADDRTVWMLLAHRIGIGQKWFDGT